MLAKKPHSFHSDFLIIGAGIVGLSVARNLKQIYPQKSIIILEKENDVGFHGSGRNSGVLHAGFYYSSDSLKAKFTRDGNKEMKDFCRLKNLKLSESGKVVVAKDISEIDTVYELEKRAIANGVEVKIIDEHELSFIDQNVRTKEFALYSPNTATVDPQEINRAIKDELIEKNVEIKFSEGFRAKEPDNTILSTLNNKYQAGKVINCAGLYADKIAKEFGFSKYYTIIPFKGIYLKYHGINPPVKINVYPVPNLKNPFLGVHFTVTVDGHVKIGPSSIPAFWRENYTGVNNLRVNELANILFWEGKLFIKNSFKFRDLAFDEIKKYYKPHFIKMGAAMVKKLDYNGFKEWGKPGIRAQLLDIRNDKLVMDFVVEGDKYSTHVLNAVSPAFTCALPFARYICDNYIITE